MTTRSAPRRPKPVDYSHIEPLPDPPREPDMLQTKPFLYFGSSLMAHFADRDDVLISGQGYLRHVAGNNAEIFAPDCVVAFGVEPEAIVARNGYVISEVGKPPDFVLEIASRSTGLRDYTVKREGYARYGVREYWRFDHTGGEFHDAPLAGDVLVEGVYEPVEITHEPGGLIWGYSAVLDLDLCWDTGDLKLRRHLAGEYLPTPEENQAARIAAVAQVAVAEAQAAASEARAAASEAQAAALEDELRQLRGQGAG